LIKFGEKKSRYHSPTCSEQTRNRYAFCEPDFHALKRPPLPTWPSEILSSSWLSETVCCYTGRNFNILAKLMARRCRTLRHPEWPVLLEHALLYPRVEAWDSAAVLRGRDRLATWNDTLGMLFGFMMHGLYPRSLNLVFAFSDHPTFGEEPKCYLGTGGCLASMMARGHWWWILHIAIFSKVQVHDPQDREGLSSFPLSFKKGVRSSFRSLFSIQAVGRESIETLSYHSTLEVSRIFIYQIDRKMMIGMKYCSFAI